MNARFDSLNRRERYVFVFGNGITAIEGVMHEILPDGVLLVSGIACGTASRHGGWHDAPKHDYHINPDTLVFAYPVNYPVNG